MEKYYVFMLFEDTLIDIDQRTRIIINAPTVNNGSPLNADRLFLNRDIISFIKRFSDNVNFTIFYRYTKKPIVTRCFNKCGFPNNVRLTFMGVDFWMRIVVPLFSPADNHHLFFICNEKQLSEIKCGKSFQELLKYHPNVNVRHIFPNFYGSAWGHFRQYTESTDETDEHASLLSANVPSLSNYFSFILNKPSKAIFLHRNTLNNSQYQNLMKNRPSSFKDLFLFDYYSTSTDSNIKDEFSRQIISQVKDASSSTGMSTFFCEAIVSHIEQSSVDLNRCLFLIYPSSHKDQWTSSLMNSMISVLTAHNCTTNTLKGLHRIKTVPKQHLTNERDENTQITSIHFDVEDISQYQFAVIIDDLTSKGTSFVSASRILRNNGFKGIIQTYAVAGTQYIAKKSVVYHPPFVFGQRETAQNGYIFDLDNTIMETDIAAEFRGKDWKAASNLIPRMKQYYCIADAIRRLINLKNDVAIVTSSVTSYCMDVLRYLGISLNDIVCVCYHDTANHKPDPDPYLVAEKMMKHNNANIFCIGDQLSDITACDRANEIDPYHHYIPAFAYWHSKSWNLTLQNTSGLKVFLDELQLVRFLGFILPNRSTLENLINNYIRPTFTDLSYSNKQIYELLVRKGYLSQPQPGTFATTEEGRAHGLGGSYSLPTDWTAGRGNITCNYPVQFEIIAFLSDIFD